MSDITNKVREIGNPRQTLIDNELERDGRQQEKERQLESVLRQSQIDRPRRERNAADEELYTAQQSQADDITVDTHKTTGFD